MAYKLVKYEGRDVLKLSPGKVTWPGEKHVYRLRGADGSFERDVLALRDEGLPTEGAEALLRTVMTGGRRLESVPSLSAVREYCRRQVGGLPERLRRLGNDERYVVEPSARLASLRRSLEDKAQKTEVADYRD
jgi:nicotinate phosphoribosyltransferase